MNKESIESIVQLAFKDTDVFWWGISSLSRPLTFEFYKNWIDQNLYADMEYLKDHLSKKETPQELLPRARSSISVAIQYIPHPAPFVDIPTPHLPIAAYAKGYDYHFWFKEKLQVIASHLAAQFKDQVFLAMTDSHPVMERDLAQRSGLGWFGKNTCLIHKNRGSFFLIGEIYTSLALEFQADIHPNHCGTCSRCIEACPTQAIIEPYVLDSNKCISYWTIEARKIPPEPLRHAIGEWFFGCDICQQVCPWNVKFFKETIQKQKPFHREDLIQDLQLILGSSNKQLQKFYKGTPLQRAGGRGLKRNALLMIARYQLHELLPDIHRVSTVHPELSELVHWTLTQLNS